MSTSITKIEQKVKQKEAMKARLEHLRLLKLNDFIEEQDLKEIEKEIVDLESKLNIKAVKKLNDLDSLLNKFDMDPTKIENTSFEYLFDNFIIKNEITMFAAPPGSGKSLISVALCNMFVTIQHPTTKNGILIA